MIIAIILSTHTLHIIDKLRTLQNLDLINYMYLHVITYITHFYFIGDWQDTLKS